MRNLNDGQSDIDMKYFVLPSKEDLYSSKVYANQTSSDTIDEDVQDVRRLEQLLFKANPAYLDLLFSPDIETNGYSQMDALVKMRDSIAKMNLSNLYSATMGTVQRNINDLFNPTSEKVQALIHEHGYNPKKAMLAVHLCTSLVKFQLSDFKDYKSAIWYEGSEREFMMKLKRGEFTLLEAKQFIDTAEKQALRLKDIYKSKSLDEATNVALKLVLRDLVLTTL